MTGVTGIYQQVFSTKHNFFFAAWLMMTSSAFAMDGITLQLGRISGSAWSAESLSLELNWQQGATASYRMRVKELIHPALSSPLKNLLISCQQGSVTSQNIACQKGMLRLQHPILDDPEIPIRFEWHAVQQKLELELSRLHVAAGELKIALQSAPDGWVLNLEGSALDLAAAYTLLAAVQPIASGAELSGKVDLTASASGVGERPARFQWRADLHKVAFSGANEAYLGEDLSGSWQGAFVVKGEKWAGEMALKLHQGAILSPYAYVGVEQQPLTITAHLTATPQRLQVTDLRYDHPGVLGFRSSATVLKQQQWVPEWFQLQTEPFAVQQLYAQYFLPILAESMLANLEWAGEARLALSLLSGGEQRLQLKLNDLHVEEITAAIDEADTPQQRRSFALYGVNGVLNWADGQKPAESILRWKGGHLMEEITLGETELDLLLHEENVTLLHHASIPVLDGSLVISTFDLTLNDDGPRFIFGGALAPISMASFSQAMGWLPLSGQLSGGIPKATYQNGQLVLEGAMLANVFEGETIIRDLRIEDLFGIWPTLSANLELKDMDLEVLTRTFSFGKITGKLEGRIDNLYLENWQPVSFDARFATPAQDESRHRISQRAIDNISNLGGGGMSGALSRTFLGFFEEFRYARLGVSCRLENGVCEMDGVEAAAQGSYLVKGSGLPRIDIVGYNHRVDWASLIGKLKEIAESGAGSAEFE